LLIRFQDVDEFSTASRLEESVRTVFLNANLHELVCNLIIVGIGLSPSEHQM
jgi:hypothetical protein